MCACEGEIGFERVMRQKWVFLFLPKAKHWDVMCIREKLDFFSWWILPLYRLNHIITGASPTKPVYHCAFPPPTHNQLARPNISNMLFRLIKYIPGFRIVWKFYINQFTADTTQPQNELPSSSSHDRLAWSKKKEAQQRMTTSEVKHVFVFFLKKRWILVTYICTFCK